jgi:hypothetical protein
MVNDSGLKIAMATPTVEGYLGMVPSTYDYTTGGFTYDYAVPNALVESGLSYTDTFAKIGLNRLQTYINNNSQFKATLIGKKYYDNNKL